MQNKILWAVSILLLAACVIPVKGYSDPSGKRVLTEKAIIQDEGCTAVISGNNVICPGQNALLTIQLSGVPPWGVFLNDGLNEVFYSIDQPLYTITVNPVVTTQYTIPIFFDAAGCQGPGLGSATIIVQEINQYVLSGGGMVCEGGMIPVPVICNGSDPFMTYNLFRNGDFTGSTMVGDGNPIIFNDIYLPGVYTVLAMSPDGACLSWMLGQVIVELMPPPMTLISGDNTIPPGGSAVISVELQQGMLPFSFGLAENGVETMVFPDNYANPMFITVSPPVTTLYTVTWVMDGTGCHNFNPPGSVLITVINEQLVTWDTPLDPQCENSTTYLLTGGLPPGGIYSGPGVENGVSFNASMTGPGIYTLTYNYVFQDGTTGTASQEMIVYPVPQVTILPVGPQCTDGPPVPLIGTPPGGGFDGPGVTNNTFNPGLVGTGQWPVTYTFSDQSTGCSGSATEIIVVSPPPQVGIESVGSLCENSPPVPLIGTPPGGGFDGPGVTGNTFNPALVGTGQWPVTYTFSDQSTGCSGSATEIIVVSPPPQVGIESVGSLCENSPPVPLIGTPPGGGFDGPGVIGNTFNPALVGTGLWPVTYTFTDQSTGCSGSATEIIEVIPSGLSGTIEGNVNYDNPLMTSLAECLVELRENGVTILQTVTDDQGYYQFPGLMPGIYQLHTTTSKSWGGGNAVDALDVLRHFVGIDPLSGLRLLAADVNASGSVNSGDALLIAKRFVGLSDNFPSGDWLFEFPEAEVLPGFTQNIGIHALCYGDVNGSYMPPKIQPTVFISSLEVMEVTGTRLSIPVFMGTEAEIGAFSLIFEMPSEGFRVEDIQTPGEGVLVFNQDEKELRLAWYSLCPLQLKPGDLLLTITGVMDDMSQEMFDLPLGVPNPTSLFAGPDARILENMLLTTPRLVRVQPIVFLGQNIPNPFDEYTEIPFNLANPAHVTLKITDLLGKEIRILTDQYLDRGRYQIKMNLGWLPEGMYLYTMEVQGDREHFQCTKKLIKQP